MGWSLNDFYQSGPAEILRALAWKTHFRENTERTILEAARMLGFWLVQPYDSEKKIKKPTDLIRFPFEHVEEAVELTEEEKEAQRKKIERWDREAREKYGQPATHTDRGSS